jgi:hypothetical protein
VPLPCEVRVGRALHRYCSHHCKFEMTQITGIGAIALAFMAQDNSVFKMVSSTNDIPLDDYTFMGLLIMGIFCFVMGIFGICTATKRPIICCILVRYNFTLVWFLLNSSLVYFHGFGSCCRSCERIFSGLGQYS